MPRRAGNAIVKVPFQPSGGVVYVSRMRTPLTALLLSLALLATGTLRAQQKCPAPPALSAGTGANIFSPQQELDLGDIEAEWLEKNYRVIHDDSLASRLNPARQSSRRKPSSSTGNSSC
jgi:hypothetical protein